MGDVQEWVVGVGGGANEDEPEAGADSVLESDTEDCLWEHALIGADRGLVTDIYIVPLILCQ